MFLQFFTSLRDAQVPVTLREYLTLMEALDLGLHDSSLAGFYDLARAICVKQVAHYDAFDAAFLHVFQGVTKEGMSVLKASTTLAMGPPAALSQLASICGRSMPSGFAASRRRARTVAARAGACRSTTEPTRNTARTR